MLSWGDWPLLTSILWESCSSWKPGFIRSLQKLHKLGIYDGKILLYGSVSLDFCNQELHVLIFFVCVCYIN